MMKKGILIFASFVAMVAIVWVLNVSRAREFALFNAASEGNLARVKLLIQNGEPINKQISIHFGWTPLIAAIYHNQPTVVQYLIQAGADVNLADRDGQTPIMWATYFGDANLATVKELISHGAKLDARDKRGATVYSYFTADPPKPKLIEAFEIAKLDQESKLRK
jgi:ankyrin repeat protein